MNSVNTLTLLRRGFTLIELLVVIAIIGILAAVVLASLNSARDRGKDAAVRSNAETIRVQAELYFNANGNYGAGTGSGRCGGKGDTTMFVATSSSDPDYPIHQAILAIREVQDAMSDTGDSANTRCAATATNGGSYATAFKLPSKDAWHCVDSAGSSKEIPGVTPPVLYISGAAAVCP